MPMMREARYVVMFKLRTVRKISRFNEDEQMITIYFLPIFFYWSHLARLGKYNVSEIHLSTFIISYFTR